MTVEWTVIRISPIGDRAERPRRAGRGRNLDQTQPVRLSHPRHRRKRRKPKEEPE